MKSLLPVKPTLPTPSRLIFILLIFAAFFLPSPYVILSPGNPQNILGSAITISGTKVYPTTGKLSVTSVLVTDPDSYITGFDVLYGWIDKNRVVLPRAQVYPEGESAAESVKIGADEMSGSQINATAAALDHLGYKNEATLVIVEVNKKSNAVGNLEVDDQIISVDNKIYNSSAQIMDYLDQKKSIKQFYSNFPDIKGFASQINEKKKSFDLATREKLVTVLKDQYKNVSATEATIDNINSLENKLAILEVDRKLKANSLLPKMDVGYHYLSEPNYWNDTNFNNYKIGVNFKFPLFLRKERGSLQLAKFKIQDTKLTLDLERIQLKNKFTAQQTEIKSIEKQLQLISSLVSGNGQMLQSEERLFSLGESSIFLINARENNLVSIQLTQLGLENRFLNSNAELFKIMANPD